MTTEQISLILTAIQTIIIVLTFIGIIWQLRQFNRNMRNDAYSKAIEDHSRISQILIDKPQVNKEFYANNADFKNLDSAQQDFYNYLALSIGLLERIFLLFKKGWIDQETWEAWERWLIQHWFHIGLFELFWENERRFYSMSFYQYVDEKYQQYKKAQQSRV
jgi:hypothetical protein